MPYEFTTDWLKDKLHVWERCLARFHDRETHALEVGSFEGRSALWLLDNILTHPKSTITCIDPHSYISTVKHTEGNRVRSEHVLKEAQARFLSNTAEYRMSGKLKYRDVPSVVQLKKLSKPFDIIYVDGCHYGSDVLTDAVLCWLLLKPNGVLIFDDYTWQHDSLKVNRELGRPRIAIDAFLQIFAGQFKLLHKGKQVIIRRLKK